MKYLTHVAIIISTATVLYLGEVMLPRAQSVGHAAGMVAQAQFCTRIAEVPDPLPVKATLQDLRLMQARLDVCVALANNAHDFAKAGH